MMKTINKISKQEAIEVKNHIDENAVKESNFKKINPKLVGKEPIQTKQFNLKSSFSQEPRINFRKHVVVKEAGSSSKTRIVNYKNISPRNMDEKMILGNPKFTSLDKIDPKYILRIVAQTYSPRVQQTHRPTYKRRYPDYINIMYSYPTNFRFLEFTLFNG